MKQKKARISAKVSTRKLYNLLPGYSDLIIILLPHVYGGGGPPKVATTANFCFFFVVLSVPVTDIQCSFASQGSNLGDIITAKLKKPIGFKGAPLFADDRAVNPEADPACSIRQDRKDAAELSYDLKITDFSRCGVLKRNVRIWCAWINLRDFLFE